jgi:hypothetical protein
MCIDNRIYQLNGEIADLERWLTEHPNHPADDKVMVRMELIRKIAQKNELEKNEQI